MIRLFIFSIFIISYLDCNSNKQEKQYFQKRHALSILVAGKSSWSYLHASNIIGKEYGLNYEVVGDCTESDQFRDSLETHNNQVYAQLAQEFGTDWKNSFDAKVDSMEFLVSQAESFVERKTDYKKREKELNSKGIILGLWTEPTSKEDVFTVEGYEISLTSQDSGRNVYYRWIVDLDKRKILSSDCGNCH